MSIEVNKSSTPGSHKMTDIISDKAIEFLNFRINEEEKSWRIYENMYLWLEDNGFTGAAKLWRQYAEEELKHANWAKDYLVGLGFQPELRQMPTLKKDMGSLPDIIRLSLEHEIKITVQCNKLAKESLTEGDFMLHELALQYLKEQHEECSRQKNWVDQLEAFGSDKIALRLLDTKMSESVK